VRQARPKLGGVAGILIARAGQSTARSRHTWQGGGEHHTRSESSRASEMEWVTMSTVVRRGLATG